MTKPRSGRGCTKSTWVVASRTVEKELAVDSAQLWDGADGASSARRQRRLGRSTAGPVEPPPGPAAPLAGPVAPPPGLEAFAPEQREEAFKSVPPPPGLAAPPGFNEVVATCPEVRATDDEAECVDAHRCSEEAGAAVVEGELVACRITISGLPNAILSEPMMSAVLQQAGLEGCVLSFSTEEGQPCGEAHIAMMSFQAAVRCVQHFEGCHWDPSGAEVTTKTEPSLEEMAGQMWDEAAKLELEVAMVVQEAVAEALEAGEGAEPDARLRAEAPAFEPRALPRIAEEAPPLQLSADAPVFVPTAPDLDGKVRTTGPKLSFSSDASTEMGDSDGEDCLGIAQTHEA
uniref:RRM domain-containing protein n=1 Tax=Alexandrium catenella TaxID=2925 RepID=A0A7S1L2R3_ALECA